MSGLSKRDLLKRLRKAQTNVANEIAGNAQRGGRFAGGLSGEGYAGGYRDALLDVEALLIHGHPSDHRGYWRKEQ